MLFRYVNLIVRSFVVLILALGVGLVLMPIAKNVCLRRMTIGRLWGRVYQNCMSSGSKCLRVFV